MQLQPLHKQQLHMQQASDINSSMLQSASRHVHLLASTHVTRLDLYLLNCFSKAASQLPLCNKLVQCQMCTSKGHQQLQQLRHSMTQFCCRHSMTQSVAAALQGACSGWKALSLWAAADGSVDMEALASMAGHCEVDVTDTAR
jgi:hypothetical protein